MRGLAGFVTGLVTHHPGTKLLALLLSFILLFVVQRTLNEKRDIRDLTIRFQLSPELRNEYVILDDTLILEDVRIEGLKQNVSEVMSELSRRSRQITIDINQAFLERYPNYNAIPLNREFYDTHEIPGEGVRMLQDLPAGRMLRIQRYQDHVMQVVLAEGEEDHTILPAEHPYQGTRDAGRRLAIGFDPPRVTLRAPPSALISESEHNELRVHIPPLAQRLESLLPDSGQVVSVQIAGIDWEGSGIRGDQDMLRYVSIVSPRSMSARMLQTEMRVRFPIEDRWVGRQVDLPIQVTVPFGRDIPEAEFVGALEVFEFREEWLDPESGGLARGFRVEVPRALADDPDALAYLILELDYTDALNRADGSARSLLVPLRLRLARGGDPSILDRVRIMRPERSDPNEHPSLRFDIVQ